MLGLGGVAGGPVWAPGAEVASAASAGTSSIGDGNSLILVSEGTGGCGAMTSEPVSAGGASVPAGDMNSLTWASSVSLPGSTLGVVSGACAAAVASAAS